MNELPLNKQFTLQKLYNDIDTLNEEDAKNIAKQLARLYHVQQQVVANMLFKKSNLTE
jgi:flagellin-specific chaperone FliS